MKTLIRLCLCLACLAAGGRPSRAAPAAGTEDPPAEGYAAIVNQRVIYVSDVMALVAPARRQIDAQYRGDDAQARLENLYAKARRSLIDRALILEDFKRLGGQVPPRAADSYIRQTIRDRFQNNRTAFLKALKQERLTLDMWRRDIVEQMILSELRQREVFGRLAVGPSAIRTYYTDNPDRFSTPEKVHVRLLVIQRGERPEEAADKRELADMLRGRLAAGEDFGALAKQFSEGQKATSGGDLGWFEIGEMDPRLADAARSLQPGEVSGVIEAGGELWIVRLEGRRPSFRLPFEQVRDDIERELRERQAESLYEQWIARLERRHYVATF